MEANLKGANVKKIEGTGGAIHQYSQDEVRGYVNLINSYLKVLFWYCCLYIHFLRMTIFVQRNFQSILTMMTSLES